MTLMAGNLKPVKTPVAASPAGTSGAKPGAEEAQLPGAERVQSTVSSIAMNRGLLGMAASSAEAAAPTMSGETTSDADIMLRVKTGDDSAFEYLVQKYR